MPQEITQEQKAILNQTQVATPHYAGFWVRAVAFVLDTLIISIPTTIVSVAINGYMIFKIIPLLKQKEEVPPEFISNFFIMCLLLIGLIYLFLFLFYFSYMESGKKQSTWGKRAMGLKVTDLNGQRLSFWHAVGRTAAKLVSNMTYYIGYMLAGWTAKKQALHDFIASTLVVYKED